MCNYNYIEITDTSFNGKYIKLAYILGYLKRLSVHSAVT